MRMVGVDAERFHDVMERCGAYCGDIERGNTHRKELWCRNLSNWCGETVVGVVHARFHHGTWHEYTIAGYLDDFYK